MYKIPANTVFMGKNLIFMPECHSTNTFALNLCQRNSRPADGTVVITAYQSAGRGQRGNTWMVEPGKNLTFSIILFPTFISAADQFKLQVFTSLAVYDYLTQKEIPNVSIKWPNDLLVNDKKVCGILVENQLMGNKITATVAGIGLNINQTHFSLDGPTSLSLVTGKEYDLNGELHHLLHALEARYLQMRHGHATLLIEEYTHHLYWINEEHLFDSTAYGLFNGIIRGVNEAGQLIVSIDGIDEKFNMKEISYQRA